MKFTSHIYLLVFIFICVFPLSHVNAEDKICDNLSDSEWIILYADSFDINAEITELRNEYLFCRLESGDSENFIKFLYFSIKGKNNEKIEQDLQMPIHDDIDIKKCIYNVSKSETNSRFKKWLICQLKKNYTSNSY